MNDPFTIAIALIMVGAVFGGIGMLAMVVRGLVRRWINPTPSAVADGEVVALREQVHALGAEVLELQERVDFAERVLAQRADAPQVPGGRKE